MEEQNNERPIVEFTEHSDYESYRRFFYFANRRNPVSWVNWIIWCGMMPLFLAIWIYGGYLLNNRVEPYQLVAAAGAAAIIVLLFAAPRRMFNKTGSRHPTVTNAAFFEDHYAYVVNSQNETHSGAVRYENVAKAYETCDAFYLKLNLPGRWYFLPKKFFTQDQVAALRALFARKFGENFKLK